MSTSTEKNYLNLIFKKPNFDPYLSYDVILKGRTLKKGRSWENFEIKLPHYKVRVVWYSLETTCTCIHIISCTF